MTGDHGPQQRRLCLVVDIEAYSGRPYTAQQRAQSKLAQALDHACERAGLSRRSCDLQDRGDGQLLLLPPGTDEGRAIPGLVLGLRDALFTLNARGTADETVRLRAALAQGSVQRAPLGFVAYSVELACRLLDSASLRSALAKAQGSDMALVVAADLYTDVFATGAGGVPTSAFRRVRIEIPEKRFSADAWVSAMARGVPVPLGPSGAPRAVPRYGSGRAAKLVGGALLGGAGLALLLADGDTAAHFGLDGRPNDEEQHTEQHAEEHTEHLTEHHLAEEGDIPMSYPDDDSGQTWDDGHLTGDDVIESADHTGYTSVSDYVAGENGYEPDPHHTGDDGSGW
ncbi:hypothetical protein ACIP9H_00950 [Streptomyces sp. NPDC088732]|uniref:hypothetical protein n=1 Tax=Streptomyces sp. NPDC088732 TaxID=3365879 RepID=UPI0038189A55